MIIDIEISIDSHMFHAWMEVDVMMAHYMKGSSRIHWTWALLKEKLSVGALQKNGYNL